MSANKPMITIHRFVFMALFIDSNWQSIEPFKFSKSVFMPLQSPFVSVSTEF